MTDVTFDMLFGLKLNTPQGDEVKYEMKAQVLLSKDEDINKVFDDQWKTIENQVFNKIEEYLSNQNKQG